MSTLLDLGDTYDLTRGCEIYVYSDAGVLSAATVTLTITLPDGTTTSPAVTTPSTGRYQSKYKPTLAGTHYVRWVAASVGGVSGADESFEDSFTVSVSTNTFVSLAEGKEFLNLQSSADDDELLVYLEVACDLAARVADETFARTSVVDTLSSNGCTSSLHLTQRPVLAVTSVTERGATVAASTGFTYDPARGVLYRMAGAYDRAFWAAGSRSNVVTYTAGYAVIPTDVRYATLVILEHLWSTQRNRGSGSARPSAREDYAVPGTNWFIPNKARDVLLDLRQPLVG